MEALCPDLYEVGQKKSDSSATSSSSAAVKEPLEEPQESAEPPVNPESSCAAAEVPLPAGPISYTEARNLPDKEKGPACDVVAYPEEARGVWIGSCPPDGDGFVRIGT